MNPSARARGSSSLAACASLALPSTAKLSLVRKGGGWSGFSFHSEQALRMLWSSGRFALNPPQHRLEISGAASDFFLHQWHVLECVPLTRAWAG